MTPLFWSTNTWTIPDEWVTLIKEYREKIDPTAVIAGGAIRDCYYGVAPKDIDIFTKSFAGLPHWSASDTCQPAFEYEGMQHIEAAVIFNTDDNMILPVNVVTVKDIEPINVVDTFDFGFCQIAFDGEQVTMTDAFKRDDTSNIITMTKIDRYQRSIRRYARINERYDRPICIPELDAILTTPVNGPFITHAY